MKKFILFLVAILINCTIYAQVPQTINWQGIIQDANGYNLDGNYSVAVKLYDVGTEGAALWTETHNSVTITDGFANIVLGSVTPINLPFDKQYWLEITVGNGTPLPRIKLSSVPYSFYSAKSNGVIVNDSLVLKDAQGVTRMVLNPNTGTFKMMNKDTVWYEVSVNSPPETFVQGKNTYQQTTFNIQEGLFVSTTYSRETNRPIQTIKEGSKVGDDGKVTQVFQKYDWDYNATTGSYIATKEVKETTDGGKETTTIYRNPTNSPDAELILRDKYSKEKNYLGEEITETEHYDKDGIELSSETKVESNNYFQLVTRTTDAHISGNRINITTIKKIGEGEEQKEQTVKEEYQDGILKEVETIETKGEEKLRRIQDFYNDEEVIDEKFVEAGYWRTNYEVKKNGTKTYQESSLRNSNYSKEEEKSYDEDGIILKHSITEKDLNNGTSLREIKTDIEYKNGVKYSEKIIVKDDANNSSEETVIYNPDGSVKTRRYYKQVNGVWYNEDTPVENIAKNTTTGQAFKQKLTPTGASFGPFYDTPGSPEFGIADNGSGTGFLTGYKTYSGEYRSSIETGYNNTVINSPGSTLINSNTNINGNSTTTGNSTTNGNQTIGGDLNVTGPKKFRITHPTDNTKYLQHAAIESNEVLNKYSGTITTGSDGFATITLPSYFDDINTNFRYNLTVISTSFAQAIIFQEIDTNNQFKIKTSEPNTKVSWEVTAKRNDAYMQNNPFQDIINK